MSSESEHESMEEGEGGGIGQWEPDDWAGSSSVDGSEDDEEQEAGPSRRREPEDLRQGLSRIPLDVLVKAQRNVQRKPSPGLSESTGSADQTRRKKRRKGDDDSDDGPEERPSTSRSHKHAPAVMSSKRQTGRSRQVIDMKASTSRDPRFMSDAPRPVSQSIIPSVLRDELAEVVASLETAKRAERYCPLSEKERWTRECTRLERRRNQLRSKLDTLDQEDRDRRALSEAKKAEREKQKAGKAPWHMKKAEKKDILLRARFEDLDKRGGKAAVRKAVEKKRKKVAGKEKKSRPFARRPASG